MILFDHFVNSWKSYKKTPKFTVISWNHIHTHTHTIHLPSFQSNSIFDIDWTRFDLNQIRQPTNQSHNNWTTKLNCRSSELLLKGSNLNYSPWKTQKQHWITWFRYSFSLFFHQFYADFRPNFRLLFLI